MKSAGSLALLGAAGQTGFGLDSALPIVDAHIHLFDPTRAGGVPWPEKNDAVIYKPALPDRYQSIAEPLGVVGAIAIEASPLASDNDWVLGVVAQHPVMLGMVGDLDPAAKNFASELERLRENPFFFGIRCGNLWSRDLAAGVNDPAVIANLRLLADAGLVMDSANPDAALIGGLVRLTERVPNLRIVVDHLPQAEPPVETVARKRYVEDLRELARSPHVFVKGSEVLRRVDGRVPRELAFYARRLQEIWEIFGEDRMLYGSDWPNSDHLADYAGTLGIIREFVSRKGAGAMEKFFWRNSQAVYRWKPRVAAQRLA
jgi:predicted TIM-barrel fold metal-dependent hydrolase